jgi:hypothetical protein
MDSRLLPVSHEKRGVALRLSVTLLALVPAELFPTVLSRALVRLVLAARGNKKHTLHEYTLGVIAEWRLAAGTATSFFSFQDTHSHVNT